MAYTVTGSRPLVVLLFPNSGILLFIFVHLVQCTSLDRTRLDSSDERLVPRRILPGWLRGDQRARAEVVVAGQRNAAHPVLPDQHMAPRRCARRRVRNGGEGEELAEDDRALARAGVLRERVAGRVCVVPHRGHDQVRAVERDHAPSGQPRAWVGLLHNWEDAEDGNDDAEDEVERDEELVERARLAREEAVHQSREHYGNWVHSRR